ncbi:MAG: hypothetical protein H6752_03095 [Candidatus Omnitrophica bacterium]|nr:hypothetical protein [Candidatus Omnitrophota bacterium]
MQEWLDSSLVFPEHWANPKPFSQNLKEIAEEIRPTVESWKANDEKRGAVRYSLIRSLRLDDQLTEMERDRILALRDEARPMLEAIARFVSASGYELDAFALLDYADTQRPINQKVDYELITWTAYRIILEGIIHAREGEWEEAFQQTLFLEELRNRNPASQTLSHLVGVSIEIMLGETIQDFAERCDNSKVLRTTLAEIEDLEFEYPDLFINSPFSFEVITRLRNADRVGCPVDLSPGHTNSYYLKQQADLVLHEESSDTSFHSISDRIGLWLLPIEYIYKQSWIDFSDLNPRIKTAEASLRLAKVEVAKRILELEGKQPVTELRVLVPDLLPDTPNDPFSETAFLWDSSSELFYSVGPDLEDDGNRIQYNPTNGVVSKGDYSLQ